MVDFAQQIQNEIRMKNEVKSDFVTYIHKLRKASLDSNSTLNSHGALFNNDIESAMLALINQRPHLKNTCAVFPAFVEYATIHPTLVAHDCSSKSCKTEPLDIDNQSALTWFLESNLENQNSLICANLWLYDQWIIPMLIKQHFTLVVVKFDRTLGKFALIQFYDSYGKPLKAPYQQQIITFFKNLGFKVKYQCLAKKEQMDNHNCGIFISLKAIDIANSNINHPERLLKKANNHFEYHKQMMIQRHHLGTLLKENGANIVICEKFKAALDNIEKICF